ncbi:MAG: M20/M25/M40 family metallo-hydrolase [Deinococcales bacterium]
MIYTEINLAQELLKHHSPTGQESAVAAYLVKVFQDLGFDEAYVDTCGNAVGIFRRGEGVKLMLNGHIDTVPLGNLGRWPYHPLEAHIADGRLWGRGASDMKAALASMALAAKDAVEAGFKGTLMVTGVVQEEVGGLGAWYLSQQHEADVVIIGEPSELRLMLGHRGRIEIHVTSEGKIAHAAKSSLGKNALYPLARFLVQLEGLELPRGGVLGGSSLTPTFLESTPKSRNVVPGEAKLIIDYRNIPGDDEAQVMARLKALAPDLHFEIPQEHFISENAQVSLTAPKTRIAFLSPGEHKLANLCRESLKHSLSHYQLSLAEGCWWFATDAPFLAQIPNGRGSKALVLGFGPGEQDLAHTTQESVRLEELSIARSCYKDLALAYSRAFA